MAGENVTGTLILPASQFVSLAATGTPPLVVASVTVVTNLNADLLDGFHGSDYRDAAKLTGTLVYARLPIGSGTWDTGTGTTLTLARSLAVTGAITGTLATPAQPNVTSLGPLTALAVTGVASVGGVLTASSGVLIPGGTFAAGKLYKEGTYGTALVGQTGSNYDLALMTPSGLVALGVLTGSRSIELGNSLKLIGAFGANNNDPVGKQGIGAAATDLASVIALANNIRTALNTIGLTA